MFGFYLLLVYLKKEFFMLLTLCFFENPAALPHLKMWENLMGDRILEKKENKAIIYTLEKEILYCIPMEFINIDFFVKEFESFRNLVYLKTLIFGKVTSEKLIEIFKFSTIIENKY